MLNVNIKKCTKSCQCTIMYPCDSLFSGHDKMPMLHPVGHYFTIMYVIISLCCRLVACVQTEEDEEEKAKMFEEEKEVEEEKEEKEERKL